MEDEGTGGSNHRLLFSAVFGDSESDCDEAEDNAYEYPTRMVGDVIQLWESVEEVEGLWRCSPFLTSQQQQLLLKAIDSEGWFSEPLHNQAMRFGELPDWALDLSSLIHTGIVNFKPHCNTSSMGDNSKKGADGRSRPDCPLPYELLRRKPLFDQMIVNSYQPGEGIAAHVDLHRFEDGIAIISLASACVMCFTSIPDSGGCLLSSRGKKADSTSNEDLDLNHGDRTLIDQNLVQGEGKQDNQFNKKVPVLLLPGDLIVMSGKARYKWTHEINREEKQQIWQGHMLKQERRISVTLRRLCSQVEEH